MRRELDMVRNDIKKSEKEKDMLISVARKKLATNKVVRDRALDLLSKDLLAKKEELDCPSESF